MRRIVWGRATSSNVMKVIWGLGNCSLPFERIDVGGSFGKTDTPEYRGMNPDRAGADVAGGRLHAVGEQRDLRYLCHAHAPHSKLWPQEPHARANIDRWMDAQQTVLNRPMGVVFWGLVRTPADKRDLAAIEQGVEDAARVWGMIVAELAKHAYIAGDGLDAGRYPVGRACASLVQHGLRSSRGAASARVVRSAVQRPAYKQHLAGAVV